MAGTKNAWLGCLWLRQCLILTLFFVFYLFPFGLCFYLMPQDVDSLVLLAGEGLVADLANVGLLSGVQPEVSVESLLLLEGHGADVANEGVVLQMPVHVVLLLNLREEMGTKLKL